MRLSNYLIYILLFFSLLLTNLSAETIAQWDFEDGTEGMSFSDMPSGGSVDVVNGYLLLGYDSTYGPAFASDESPAGLCGYCNGQQDAYTTEYALNEWSPQTWTIEISAKLEDLSDWETFIGRDGSTNGDPEADFYLQKNDVGGQFRLNYETVSGERWILDSDFTAEADNWYHLAVTSDGQTLTMYCDKTDGRGFQVAGTLDISSQTPAENAMAATDYSWTVGRGWYDGNNVDHITGFFDNVRFSDSVLSPSEFMAYSPFLITETESGTVLFRSDTACTDSYSIVMAEQPEEDVVITANPPEGLTLGSGDGQPADITFTSQNWDSPQQITVQISDPSASFENASIQHTASSTSSRYDGLAIRDVEVQIADDSCGIWGYLEGDYNMDCKVDIEDYSICADINLLNVPLIGLKALAHDWLLNTLIYDQQIYSRSIQELEEPNFIDTSNILHKVDINVYGHFLEHIYHSVNGGLWGEMIWNRSFELTENGAGTWSKESGELIQSSLGTDIHFEFGEQSWTDYELTLEARKDEGAEGFLIVFRAEDSDNLYWLNLGGWENSQHAVEKETDGGRSTLVSAGGSINTDQWYDIRIRCEGNNFEVYVNENLLFDFSDSTSPFLTGRIGLGSWATKVRYRNIEAADLSGENVLFSGLPDLPIQPFNAESWQLYGDVDASISSDALNNSLSAELSASAGGAGLQQNNFKFTQQPYHGSLWVKGSMPDGLKIEFLDGDTVLGQEIIPAPESGWDDYPFSITPSAETENGSMRILSQGAGDVKIDQVSMMGQDSIDAGGFRPDLLEAVEGLSPPIIRWPGGCFASLYFWKDAIGPQHERTIYPAYMWDDQDINSYGTDEFIRMCEKIGSEPLLVINTGVLDSACGAPAQWKHSNPEQYLQDALDWMEYCNGSTDTTWGAKRAQNGHPEPYNVTYWEIDNETWAAGSAAYIDKVQAFAPALRQKADELGVPIKLIAVGGGSYDMNWNRDIIDSCAELIDYISVHHYEGADGYALGPENYDNFLTDLSSYIAGSANPDMKIYNSEWNLQTIDWRTGLFAGGILNVYEKHGGYFKLGGPALFLRHTSASGWNNAFINFDHTDWFPAPNYVVMKLWRDHYAPNYVQTEGPDNGMSISSVLSEDEQTLYVHIVNPQSEPQDLEFELDGSFVPEEAYLEYAAPGDLYAQNTMENPDAVSVESKGVGLSGQVIRFNMPAYSAGVLTVETGKPHKTEFLYSYFKGNGEDGLHLAYSEDGKNFTALNNDQSLLAPNAGSGLMRDPSISQGPDGTFHMVWTTGWWDKGIGVAHSDDLINWSEQTFLPVMADEPDAQNCWAPEIFYDEQSENYFIFWATTIDGAFPETYNPDDDNNHRIYCVKTKDFSSYSDTQLFYEPGFNVIDAFITKTADEYAMVVKDETKAPAAQKNLRLAFSSSAEGPYSDASEPISPSGLWVEGPSMVKAGGQWVIYYDAYTEGYMGAIASEDMKSWNDITDQVSFPSGTRHGTVFRVTDDVLNNLKQLAP
ncbi:Intracellular exo-alpha-(1-_5)-L-arabinofuranosidase [Sedimentisphaera cyanobacteriorum]|uniref:non-reducing end alpha-L-arabinofuranosidase n=1 Tax=Sedimentisphaera cyanobacteriorum TaxID=1940790 RepID=A0A1Q2HM21_9BACT|nr:LamG-like jellyroll fold domain-containing protein [Sedimentisphaera cyanobacteriorum]AQQ08304.1 Intracellular exo-alpha-(1->5)-L-arabinofuranosidase [Sedimentisphaera cyanobacteriorum]